MHALGSFRCFPAQLKVVWDERPNVDVDWRLADGPSLSCLPGSCPPATLVAVDFDKRFTSPPFPRFGPFPRSPLSKQALPPSV